MAVNRCGLARPEQHAAMDAGQPTRWPYDDRWGGASMTHGRAQAEAWYASSMFAAAMRGKLPEFEYEQKRSPG